MLTRILLLLCLCTSLVRAAGTPSPSPSVSPTDASIKQLLEVAQTHKLVDSVIAQMNSLMLQAIAQATKGQQVSPKIQKDIDRRRDETVSLMKELLDWKKLEPMYVRIYQKSFNQQEIDSLIAMYKSPTGQMLLNKMPIVLQNSMNEMQQMMQPVMQRIQRMQRDVIAQMQAEREKKGG